MIPNVFVSSTIQDLPHFREVIRELITSFGFMPVLSEDGDVGYLATESAESSCYLSVAECQLFVLIIGKRYGSVGKAGVSVTHNEFREAHEKQLPVLCLIDNEVIVYKRVFDAHQADTALLSFPGMDNPTATFGLIDEFTRLEINNGYMTFSSAADACSRLRKQMALLFGSLLRKNFDPVKSEIREVHSLLETIRHELLTRQEEPDKPFFRLANFLRKEKNQALEEFLGIVSTNESAIEDVLQYESLDALLEAMGYTVSLTSRDELHRLGREGTLVYGMFSGDAGLVITEDHCVHFNQRGMDMIYGLYANARAVAGK